MSESPQANAPLTIEQQLSQIQDTLKTIIGSNLNPLRILNTLYDIDNQAMKVAKTLGVGGDNALNIKTNITATVEQVRLLGGQFEDVVKIQSDAAQAIGRNVILSSDIYEGFVATVKVTGQETPKLVNAFKDIGLGVYDVTEQMKTVVNSSRAIGVNAKIVSETVVRNIGALNMYNFKDGVEGLSKMAAQATNLRIDMSRTLEFTEKVYNPEGAIETAAALQRLGVIQSDLLDPLRLMDLSQNDPAELQNQLVEMSKQFVKLNEQGRFEIMPGEQRRLREISKELGISYDQLTKMAIGASELEDKMKKISLPDTFTKEQQMMIANMAELEGGEYKITVDGKTKTLDEAVAEFKRDGELLEKFMEDQKPIEMVDLAKKQLSFVEDIAAKVNALVGKVPFGVAGSENADFFMKTVRDGFGKVTDGFSEFIGTTEDITNSFNGVVEYMKTLGDDNTTIVGKILTQSEDLINIMSKVYKDGFENLRGTTKNVTGIEIGENIAKTITNATSVNVNDFIKLPGQVIQPLPQDTLFGGTGFEEMMNRIASVTNIQKNNTEISTPSSRTTTADINVNFKIDAPPQIDTNQLLLALNTTDFKQTIIKTVADAFSPDETSSSKKMNSFART